MGPYSAEPPFHIAKIGNYTRAKCRAQKTVYKTMSANHKSAWDAFSLNEQSCSCKP